jgi:hypothetical protein
MLVIAVLSVTAATAADLSADQIMDRSFKVYGGDDSVSTLTFTFDVNGEPERKLVYTMVWKKYAGKENTNAKFLFIKEFPAANRGTAYMAWRYRPYADMDDDEWIYLPETRTVRKLSHRDNLQEDEEFAITELKPKDLEPRDPSRDRHNLLRTEEIEGKQYYLIESVRKDETEFYPYAKVWRWISADTFLPTYINYFDFNGHPLKREQIEWQQIGDAWVWKSLDVNNIQNGNKTRLDVSDIRLNVGIDDDVFSKRTMRTGLHGRL